MHVELDHITKQFGTLRANDAISMSLDGGQIYAILGENGAGKSTLMKILSGYQPADSGRILIAGQAVEFRKPADALAYGIGMLHQDPLDVSTLTVLDNFILGKSEGLLPNRREARRMLLDYAKRLGFTFHPDAYIDSLTIGERQQLEIVRLLSRGAHLLILDEPTTGISEEQKHSLFNSLKRLARDEGMSIVLVSHKLQDVEALCDQVYVLRAGKVIGHQTMPYPTDQLIEMMFGQTIEMVERDSSQHGEVLLRVQNLCIPDDRLTLEPISLDIYTGEVIGLAGLDGSGQRAFLRACAGLQLPSDGHFYLGQHDIRNIPYHDRVKCGISYGSAGRLEEGLAAGLTLAEHFSLVFPDGIWIDKQKAEARTKAAIDQYKIRGQPSSLIETLSGGNQQRVLLALLPRNLKLLLLENPTRGLDVESARWVWSQLLERQHEGTTIIFISPELDEIIHYSDRIGVFFGGHMTLIDDPSQLSSIQLGELIGGKAGDKAYQT